MYFEFDSEVKDEKSVARVCAITDSPECSPWCVGGFFV